MSDWDDMVDDRAEHHQCLAKERAERTTIGDLMRQYVQEQATSPEARAEAAAHVLWHTGNKGGFPPGHFTALLLRAWDWADNPHRERLAGAFPAYGWAVDKARAGAYDLLRHTATKGRP